MYNAYCTFNQNMQQVKCTPSNCSTITGSSTRAQIKRWYRPFQFCLNAPVVVEKLADFMGQNKATKMFVGIVVCKEVSILKILPKKFTF